MESSKLKKMCQDYHRQLKVVIIEELDLIKPLYQVIKLISSFHK